MCRRAQWLQLRWSVWLSEFLLGLHAVDSITCASLCRSHQHLLHNREISLPSSAHLLAWPLQDALSSLFARVIQSKVVPASKLLEWGTVDSMLALLRKSGSTDVTRGSAALFLSEAAQQLEDISCLHQAGAVAALLGEQRSI